MLNQADLEKGFAKFDNWRGIWVVDGKRYGSKQPRDQWRIERWPERVDLFLQTFPDVRTVLEISCWEGGLTSLLARRVERVVSVEGRPENIEKAKYVLDILGLSNVEFIQTNFENSDWADSLKNIKFDAVFCSGILYHLTTPWVFLKQVSAISDKIFIWSCYVSKGNVSRDGYRGKWRKTVDLPESGMADRQFWMEKDSLIKAISTYYPYFKIFNFIPKAKVPNITIAAWDKI